MRRFALGFAHPGQSAPSLDLAGYRALCPEHEREKFKRLALLRKAIAKMQEIARRYPGLFAHWRYATAPAMTW
ncbi:hypothetical protein [Streptomyces malaysiensis]|uniref:hypothetical protein n=1 Tax=Streptomyces malaysiensis TaxID=92644 RepID=UPI003714EA93